MKRRVNKSRLGANKTKKQNEKDTLLLAPGLDNTRLFISLSAGAGTRCMSLSFSSPNLSFWFGEMKIKKDSWKDSFIISFFISYKRIRNKGNNAVFQRKDSMELFGQQRH